MDMVRHCMTFNQLYSLLPTQLSQNTSYVTAERTIQCFLPVFRNKNNVIFAIMLYVSLALPVSHMASLLNLPVQRRPISYPARRFGRAFSNHTARGGGLPRFNYHHFPYSLTPRFWRSHLWRLSQVGNRRDRSWHLSPLQNARW